MSASVGARQECIWTRKWVDRFMWGVPWLSSWSVSPPLLNAIKRGATGHILMPAIQEKSKMRTRCQNRNVFYCWDPMSSGTSTKQLWVPYCLAGTLDGRPGKEKQTITFGGTAVPSSSGVILPAKINAYVPTNSEAGSSECGATLLISNQCVG